MPWYVIAQLVPASNHLQKTRCLEAVATSVGLRINTDETKLTKVKTDRQTVGGSVWGRVS